MALTKVGAFFAAKSLLLLRIYIPDSDDSEIARQHVGAGESVALVPIEVFRAGGPKAVQDFIGAPAHSGVCAVVHRHTNVVIDRIIAEPELYSHPQGHLVIQHDGAAHGDLWDGRNFIRRPRPA
jgi:hypothetical protein